ncbi:MAG: glycosyltransferase [Pirellulaceae bacterium]|jgi:hypothetical protein|nr:glycosyltransferase [Pirellulaceae bacterium]
MRIFYACPETPHQGCLPSSQIWHNNLYLPLRDLGHELVRFAFDFRLFNEYQDPDNPQHAAFIAEHRPRLSEELVRQVGQAHRREPLDLFFSYFYSSYVLPEAIREIRDLGIVTMNWYCNASYQFHLIEEIAPAFDYCLVPEKFRLEDYRRVGARPIYCQEAANPQIYKPADVPQPYDVTFVGQRYGTRPLLIGRLISAGVDARVWGPKWREQSRTGLRAAAYRVRMWRRGRPWRDTLEVPRDRCGPPLDDEELIRMYSRSRISLGFTAVAELPRDGSPAVKQVRLRDFEATMSGAFYLVEAFDELAEFFEPDREIVFFHDADDLVDKARYYLRHEEEREQIRQAGLRRARAEHTWQARFRKILREVGLAAGTLRCAG